MRRREEDRKAANSDSYLQGFNFALLHPTEYTREVDCQPSASKAAHCCRLVCDVDVFFREGLVGIIEISCFTFYSQANDERHELQGKKKFFMFQKTGTLQYSLRVKERDVGLCPQEGFGKFCNSHFVILTEYSLLSALF